MGLSLINHPFGGTPMTMETPKTGYLYISNSLVLVASDPHSWIVGQDPRALFSISQFSPDILVSEKPWRSTLEDLILACFPTIKAK